MEDIVLLYIVMTYCVFINVLTFGVYGIDKWKAERSMWRVSEATLLGMAVLGGSIGAWLGMKFWRHKTMRKKFRYGIPIILVAQIVILSLSSCKTERTVGLALPIQEDGHVQEHSQDVFIVMYDVEIGKEPLLRAIKHYKCEIVYDYGIINGMALKKPEDKTLEEAMRYFRKVKGVFAVESDHIMRLTDPVPQRMEIMQ